MPSFYWAALFALTAVGPPADDKPAEKADSYRYYGPNGLADYWHDPTNKNAAAQRLGRDTWIHWTWGNQKFLRRVAVVAGSQRIPVSVDFFRILDSRNRANRFRDLGLINEPNTGGTDKDILAKYGLYLDAVRPDPYGYYPGGAKYAPTYPGTDEKVDTRHYGRPSGVVGLRLFDNPKFEPKKWDVNAYFRNPAKVEPPFLVGFSCGFCHVAFDPNNPPKDPAAPRWDNLAANLGNQYFREGEIFLGGGRVILGDQHPDPLAPADSYRSRGLLEGDFLFQYSATQQPGTSETSRISYDFINNPNTINPLMSLPLRAKLYLSDKPKLAGETTPGGVTAQLGLSILKDGSDSVGLRWALMRVPINIGCEGDYWLDRLFNPLTGKKQRPFRIGDVLGGLPDAEKAKVKAELGDSVFADDSPARRKKLREQFRSPWAARGEEFGDDWLEAWKRISSLQAYLLSYGPTHLKDATKATLPEEAKAAEAALPKDADVERGKKVFLAECAKCHSSTLVGLEGEARKKAEDAFPRDDFLADDRRKSAKELGTNLGRAVATNAIDGDIWAEFSSRDYKALPPLGRLELNVPVFIDAKGRKLPPIPIEFEPPGGGRGYYRTPSLIGMWATAPYLHNNALGDYRVIDEKGSSIPFPNDGRRIGRRKADGSWENYPIDVSVAGRLAMFQDGMEKMLWPEKRRGWVKRVSDDCKLVPDLSAAAPAVILSLARDLVRDEVRDQLRARPGGKLLESAILPVVDDVFDRVAPGVLQDAKAWLRFARAAVHLKLREHADRLLDLAYEDLKEKLAENPAAKKLPLGLLKPKVRAALMAKLDSLEKNLRDAAILTIPAGTPVNLYANLGAGSVIHAAAAHVTLKDDREALVRKLLELSDCPDLEEDRGHTYGKDLMDADKRALIEFLKTL